MKTVSVVVAPLLALALAWGAPAPAQAATVGSGTVISEARPVAPFEAISVGGSIVLDVRQTGKEALSISADDNILPLIETVVESTSKGPTLVIRPKRGESIRTRNAIKVTVEVARLSGLHAAGAGEVSVGPLTTPKLDLSLSGSNNARLSQLSTEALEVRIAGSGDVRAEGNAKRAKLAIAGSGNADLTALAADDVTVSIAGSGNAQIHATKALAASIAGSGDVVYGGNPPTLKSSIAGSGRITKR